MCLLVVGFHRAVIDVPRAFAPLPRNPSPFYTTLGLHSPPRLLAVAMILATLMNMNLFIPSAHPFRKLLYIFKSTGECHPSVSHRLHNCPTS